MRTIHWYPLEPGYHVVPTGGSPVVRYVGGKDGFLRAWVEVDPASSSGLYLHVIGTGQSVPENTAYVGSAVVGQFVWHVYQ